jgi:hypothetical protein
MNVGAKIFGSPSGEPKQHNQTNAQKKMQKTLDTHNGSHASSLAEELCPAHFINGFVGVL